MNLLSVKQNYEKCRKMGGNHKNKIKIECEEAFKKLFGVKPTTFHVNLLVIEKT
jgi:hypothetical protein